MLVQIWEQTIHLPKTEQCLRDLTAVCRSQRPTSKTCLNNTDSESKSITAKCCSAGLKNSTHLTLLCCFDVSNNTWRSGGWLSGLWGADSCLTRGEDQPPSPEGTWHVPSNALLCWLRRITILRLARQKVSQPPRHPNSSAGRNPVVLSAPISLLCVYTARGTESSSTDLPCQQSLDNSTLPVLFDLCCAIRSVFNTHKSFNLSLYLFSQISSIISSHFLLTLIILKPRELSVLLPLIKIKDWRSM